MTINSASSRASYIGVGSVGPFPFAYRIFAATDLVVTKATDTGLETTLSYPADYSVSGVGNRNGGSLTLTQALPSNYALTIRRVLTLLQPANIRNQGSYFPETHEDAFDRNVMMIQQIAEVNLRTMTLPVSVDPANVSAVLPLPMANRVLIWNANATALQTAVLDSSAVGVPGEGRTTTTATAFLANNAEYNIHDWGSIGNGVFDSSVTTQNALNAAGVAGGRVRIPVGTYKHSAMLTIPSNVTIIGDGAAALVSAPGMGALNVFQATGSANITFDGFAMSGTFGVGISATSCTNVVCRNLTISGATVPVVATGSAAGIAVSQCQDVTIEGCYFFGNGTPSETTAGFDIKCNGLDYHGTKRHFIRNNRCLSTGVYINICGFNLQESEISGNECAGAKARVIALNGGYGILLYATGFFTPWSGVTTYINGDVVYSGVELYVSLQNGNLNHTPASSPTWWSLVDHSVRDNRVVNNHIHDVGSSCIYTANGRRTIISHNLCENFGAELDEASNPVAGISVNGGVASVTSNRVRDSIRSGITFSDVHEPGGIIANNAVDRCTGNAGVRLGGLTEGVAITGNVINDCANGITAADPAWLVLGCTITHNTINRSASRGILIIYPVSTSVDHNTIRESGATGIELDIAAAGRNNSASGNLVVDSNQAAGGWHNMVVLSPYSTYNNNRVGNTLALGAEKGLVVSAGAAVGSVAVGNTGFNNRTADFDFPDALVRGGNRDTANVSGAFTLGSTAMIEGAGGAIAQLVFGSAPVTHSIGKQFSTSDFLIASNASQVAADLWHQNLPGSLSTLERRTLTGNVEHYTAAAGVADGAFAAFWGAPVETLTPTGNIKIGVNQILTARQAAIADTSGATLPNVEIEVNKVKAMLRVHGLMAP